MKKVNFVAAMCLAGVASGCTDMEWHDPPFKYCPDNYTRVYTDCPNGVKCIQPEETLTCRLRCEQGYKFVDKCEAGIACKTLEDNGICDEMCPKGMRGATDNKCPEGVECVKISSGRVCMPGGAACEGNCQNAGANCPSGYITVSATEEKSCKKFDDEASLEDEILSEDVDLTNATNFYCIEGKIKGRFCRKAIPDVSEEFSEQADGKHVTKDGDKEIRYNGAEIPVLDGQVCTPEDLVVDKSTVRIHIIDVGNGDSIWIETPGGKNILIDGGESMGTATVAGPIINDYLEFHGFAKGSTFDVVFLSHPHSDHYGGFNTVFASGNYKLARYVDSMELGTNQVSTSGYKQWIDKVKSQVKSENIYMPAEEKLTMGEVMPKDFFGEGVTARYLFSRKTLVRSKNVNSASLYFTLEFGGTTMIFGGDGEKEDEEEIIKKFGSDNPILKSKLLKVCHHGSNTSSSEAWLNAIWKNVEIKERGAFISSGRRKYSGTRTLRQEILERLKEKMADGYQLLLSTNAGDDDKESDKDAVRDDNILVVIKPDGSVRACYEGVN